LKIPEQDPVFEEVTERTKSLWNSPWRPLVSVTLDYYLPRSLEEFEREMVLLSVLDTISQQGGLLYVIRMGPVFAAKIFMKRILRRPKEINVDENFAYRLWLLRSANGRGHAARKRSEEAPGITVSVLMNVQTLTEDVACSVRSLIQQVHRNWRLLLLSAPNKSTDIPEFVAEHGLTDERISVATDLDTLALGDVITFLEPGDILEYDALLEVAGAFESSDVDAVYTDEDKISKGFRHGHFFKPDWSPELLLSTNYVGHLYAIRKELWKEDPKFPRNDSEYFDLVLRTTSKARKVFHIPKILYSKLMCEGEATPTHSDIAKVVERLLRAREIAAIVRSGLHPGTLRVRSKIEGNPMMTLIVPTYRRFDLLQDCLASVRHLSTYKNYQILILYHGTTVPGLLLKISRQFGCTLVRYPDPRYAFGEMNNFGSAYAKGDYLVFLNDDTRVITPSWLEAMLEWAQLREIAAVGAKLLNADNTINHAGDIIVGRTPTTTGPMHAFKGIGANSGGYNCLADTVRNCTCVTAACMMIRKKTFDDLGGFNGRFTSYDDVDLCLRALERGYRNVYTPFAVLYHFETASRKGQIRAIQEYRSLMYLRERHPDIMKTVDPYYNRNLDPEGSHRLSVTAKPEDIPRLYLE
jgi:GT2 family glycosyltransferase